MGFKILQIESEIAEFCELVRAEGVTSYLEIGSCWGGSLDRIVRSMPRGSRAVSVDLPGKRGNETEISLRRIVDRLRGDGYGMTLIFGNSHAADIISRVRLMAPFDLVMIDGDHSGDGVRADWRNYGSLGRMVAFHDANDTKDRPGRTAIEVHDFWRELRDKHERHREIFYDEGKNGIGVLWRN